MHDGPMMLGEADAWAGSVMTKREYLIAGLSIAAVLGALYYALFC
jgi:hypothetical protein